MFFTVEPKLPFQTTEDALMAVPNWKVLIVPGDKGSMKAKAVKGYLFDDKFDDNI